MSSPALHPIRFRETFGSNMEVSLLNIRESFGTEKHRRREGSVGELTAVRVTVEDLSSKRGTTGVGERND